MKSKLIFILSTVIFISCSSDNGTNNLPDNIDHGGVIAYTYQPLQGGIHQIYTINEDGTGNHQIVESNIGLNHHDWSRDGTRIVCVGYIGSNFNTWSIHVFNADGTGLIRLTATSNVYDNEPRWSPDGSRIAFTRIFPNDNFREEIWLMNPDGSNQHSIEIGGNVSDWSTDGNRLLYAGVNGDNYDIFTCDLNGENIVQLTDTNLNESFPTFSPNGNQIAYSTFEGAFFNEDNGHTFEINIMNSDGTNIRQLTDNNYLDSVGRWSPDGTKLVYTSDAHATGRWEVYIMNTDGTNIRRVTISPNGVTAINPVWRPE
ncbi:TolB family protein [Bacteroidota bacterium]